MRGKALLYIGLITGVFAYLFWQNIPVKGLYYIGNALMFFCFGLYMYIHDLNSSIKFTIFCLSLNNLLDELFFDNTKIGINEIFFSLIVLIYLIYKNYAKIRDINRGNI